MDHYCKQASRISNAQKTAEKDARVEEWIFEQKVKKAPINMHESVLLALMKLSTYGLEAPPKKIAAMNASGIQSPECTIVKAIFFHGSKAMLSSIGTILNPA